MGFYGVDRYCSTQPCAVCGAMTSSSVADLCSSHKSYVACAACGEHVDETQRSRNGNLCNDCYLARSCDVCGREDDDIRAGVEARMCPRCWMPETTEEVA
jgi:NMD protein affecting ribosome stability and mRNA decay